MGLVGRGHDELERRPGRRDRLGHVLEHRRPGRAGQGLQRAGVDRRPVDVVVERRGARDGEDLPRPRVHRDGGADLAPRPGLRANGRGEAGVQLPLQAQVEGQPQVGAGHGVLPLAERRPARPRGRRTGTGARRSRAAPRRTAARARPGRRSRPAADPGQRFSSCGRGHPGEAEHRPEQRALRVRPARAPGRTNTPGIAAAVTASPTPRGHVGHRQRQRGARRRAELCERGPSRGRPISCGEPIDVRRAGRAAGRAPRAPGPRRCRRPRRSRRAARRAGR